VPVGVAGAKVSRFNWVDFIRYFSRVNCPQKSKPWCIIYLVSSIEQIRKKGDHHEIHLVLSFGAFLVGWFFGCYCREPWPTTLFTVRCDQSDFLELDGQYYSKKVESAI
jgi:hypothetical protein